MRDDFAGIETGSAFVFERMGGVWTDIAKLTANQPFPPLDLKPQLA